MKTTTLGLVSAVLLLACVAGCRQAEAGGARSAGEGAEGAATAMGATAALVADDVVGSAPGARREADPEVWEIVGKIPKPEAMIFENRADTPIPPVDDKKSFLDRIGDPVKKDEPPSEGKE